MDIKAEIAKAKAAAEAAAAKLSEVQDDVADRAELDGWRAKQEEAERQLRDLDLDKREDAAREVLGEKVKIGQVAIKGYPDTFIVIHDPDAYKLWKTTLEGGKKHDAFARDLRFAMAVIHDWNGITDWDKVLPNGRTGGDALRAYLTDHPAMVTPITNEAGRLAGLYKEERKSGRR